MNDLDKRSTSLLICSLPAVIITIIVLAVYVHRRNRSRKTKDELENDDYEEHIPYGGQMYGAYSEEMRNFCSRDHYIDSRSTIMDLYDEANEKAVAWVPPPPPPPPDPPIPHS